MCVCVPKCTIYGSIDITRECSARIKHGARQYYLGVFNDSEKAARAFDVRAYDCKALELKGGEVLSSNKTCVCEEFTLFEAVCRWTGNNKTKINRWFVLYILP